MASRTTPPMTNGSGEEPRVVVAPAAGRAGDGRTNPAGSASSAVTSISVSRVAEQLVVQDAGDADAVGAERQLTGPVDAEGEGRQLWDRTGPVVGLHRSVSPAVTSLVSTSKRGRRKAS